VGSKTKKKKTERGRGRRTDWKRKLSSVSSPASSSLSIKRSNLSSKATSTSLDKRSCEKNGPKPKPKFLKRSKTKQSKAKQRNNAAYVLDLKKANFLTGLVDLFLSVQVLAV